MNKIEMDMRIDYYVDKYSSTILIFGYLILTIVTSFLYFLGKLSYVYPILLLLGWGALALYCFESHILKRVGTDALASGLNCNIDGIASSCIQRILDLLFVFSYIVILLAIQVSESRSIVYPISIIMAICCIILSTYLSDKKIIYIKNIFKSVMLFLVMVLSFFKIYYWVGWDVWTHAAYNELIATVGNIHLVLGKEASYPIQHISVGITELLVSVDVRYASILAVTIPGVLLSVTLFILAKNFFNNKLGIIALLLFATSTYVIYWLISPIPTSYAFILYLTMTLVFFEFLLSSNNKSVRRYLLLFVFFLFVTVLTHMFSTFIIAFIIMSLYLASIVSENRIYTKLFLPTIICFFIILTYWLIVESGFEVFIRLIHQSLTISFQPSVSLPDVAKYVNIAEPSDLRILLTNIWLPITGCVCFVASYIYCSYSLKAELSGSVRYFGYVLIPFVICIVSFAGLYFFYPAMAIRFTAFFAVLCVLSTTYIFYHYLKKTPNTTLRQVIMIMLIVSLISFVSITQPTIYQDNTPWYKETYLSSAITTQEVIGAETLTGIIPSTSGIGSDRAYSSMLSYAQYKHRYNVSRVVPSFGGFLYVQPDWADLNSLNNYYLVFRNVLLDIPTENIVASGATENQRVTQMIQLDPELKVYLDSMYDTLYDNGGICLYDIV